MLGGGGLGLKNIFSRIQPNLVCELLTGMAHATAHFFGPRPHEQNKYNI